MAAKDYYRSLDDANTYFTNQLHTTDWDGATDATKEKALLAAARAIDSLRFKGYKVPLFDILFDSDGNEITSVTQAAIEAADLSQAKEWPRDGLDFAPDTPSTVQTLLQYSVNPTTGTITIQVTLADETTFTTAAVAYDAVAATIQTAVDTAAAAALASYTAGDIAVTGGPLTTGDVTLTFSGDSVKDQAHSARPVVTGTGGFDGTLATPNGKSVVTGECPDRVFFAQCEEAISLISGKRPDKEFENLRLTSDGVSSTRVSTDPARMPPEHTAHFFTSATAWKYLKAFLDPENSSFDLERL